MNAKNKKTNIAMIRAVTEATASTFEQMCAVSVEAQKPFVKKPGTSTYGISGVIGLTGEVQGVFVLTFPEEVSLKVVSNFIGEKLESIDPSLIDGVKELANIIIGAGKANLEQTGYQFSFSLPKIVVGHTYITTTSDVNSIVIPFKSDLGEFFVDVSIRD